MSPGTPYIAILSKRKCLFLFYKIGEHEGRPGPVTTPVGVVRNWERVKEVNMVQTPCTYVVFSAPCVY
jgi:hypothetical protein